MRLLWLQNLSRVRSYKILLLAIVAVGALFVFGHLLFRAAAQTDTVHNVLRGQWAMPGARMQGDGLHVSYTGGAIVEQNGSGGQADFPINLAGTHMAVSGDFAVAAQITNMSGAALQLYGQVPIVSDEFRVERPSVRLTIGDNNTLVVTAWDGSATNNLAGQKPVQTETFSFVPSDKLHVEMKRQNKTLTFSVNGAVIGSVAEHDVFRSGQLWFGAAATRPAAAWVLSELQAYGLNQRSKLTVVDGSNIQVASDAGGLQNLAAKKRPDFLVGAAIAPGPLYSDPRYQKIFFQNFGTFTFENALKRQFIEPQPGMFTFEQADAMLALAKQHGITQVNGHALLFGEANPSYVTNRPLNTEAEKRAAQADTLDYVRTVVGHFKGKVTSWDVINEPLADYDAFDPSAGAIYRNHVYYRAFGLSYIAEALRTAREADPTAQLFINEFGLEQDGERWDAMLALAKQLVDARVPLTGIGFQAHVYSADDKIDPDVLKKHIQQLAQLGLKARISEMDVYGDDGQQVQAEQYRAVLDACLSENTCVSFTTWGVTDAYDVWQDDHSLQYGQDLLWDNRYNPTLAVAALQNLLKN